MLTETHACRSWMLSFSVWLSPWGSWDSATINDIYWAHAIKNLTNRLTNGFTQDKCPKAQQTFSAFQVQDCHSMHLPKCKEQIVFFPVLFMLLYTRCMWNIGDNVPLKWMRAQYANTLDEGTLTPYTIQLHNHYIITTWQSLRQMTLPVEGQWHQTGLSDMIKVN